MHLRPKRLSIALALLLIASGTAITSASPAHAAPGLEVQSLDGSGNNRAHPNWGKVGQNYPRVAAANYADGRSTPIAGPNVRAASNRIIQDHGQNIFSEHRVTQWGWTWGQFLDHTFGLVDGAGETANIPFDSTDPMERFTDSLGVIPFTRSRPAPGTGVGNPRQQINTVSTYIDAWAVYGGTNERLEWLRDGPVDGNLANNSAKLMLPGGYLPRRSTRGNPSTAPDMALDGRLLGHPDRAMVAGDVRANENVALTAAHTLFAREHNRIVSLLPNTLTNEEKFQIARRVVIAEQQYVTYNEFLPAMGVNLPTYTGYNANVNASLTDEFATIGYRSHSQIHGEFEIEVDAARYTSAELAALAAAGVEVEVAGDEVELGVPLNLAFFNPDLLTQLKLGPMLAGIGGEPQYNNDEQIDDQLRSVLFQVPVSGNPECLSDPSLPACFNGVVDLGALDIQRGRDHGMPTYNQLRQAYGLAPKPDFKSITGESSEAFPPGTDANNPASLDFTNLFDINGAPVPLGSDDSAFMTRGVRRTPLAARLKAVYGSVDKVDGFAGMISERHVPGTEFGELQLAIWARQFQALRDGDRFFYGADPGLSMIASSYGINYRHTLAQIIAANTDIPAADLNDNVFLVDDADVPAATCAVSYHVDSAWNGEYQVSLVIRNLTRSPVNGWTVGWQFPGGQSIRTAWNSVASQRGSTVSLANPSWNTVIPAGGTVTDAGFIGRWDNTTNPIPTNVTLNNRRCARG
jgi:peroxidase